MKQVNDKPYVVINSYLCGKRVAHPNKIAYWEAFMDIFDLPIEEFKKELNKIFSNITPKELLQELIECGLEVYDEKKDK